MAAAGPVAATLASGGERVVPSSTLARDGSPPVGARPQGTSFHRWTWVHGNGDRSPEEWPRRFSRLAEAGFHGVLVGGGDTTVLSGAAHEAGLEFHRWVWTLNRNGDAWVQTNHPEWFTVSREGHSSLERPPYVPYYKWLCPTRPEVRAYLRESMVSIARDPAVDGVHLDYVRHCDVILPRGLWAKYDLVQDREYPPFDFCYCDLCRETFAATHHRDPLGLADPASDADWRRFRWNSVTELVEILAEAVHGVPTARQEPGAPPSHTPGRPSVLRPEGDGKPITAAVFPTPAIARRLVRQAWDQWPVDAVFPMLYHGFYEEDLAWIGAGVREGLAAIGARAEGQPYLPTPRQLHAGLYLPDLPAAAERIRAEAIARDAGAHGVSFFELGGLET